MLMFADNRHAIVSQSGDAEHAGRLIIFDTLTHARRVLYPQNNPPPFPFHMPFGEQECTAPLGEDFSPHGIDLVDISGGLYRLYVVNRKRQAIEIFHIIPNGINMYIAWHGCIMAPPDSMMSDVVGTVDGFYATNTRPQSSWFNGIKAWLAMDTGNVWHWDARGTQRILPHSQGPFPDGIALDGEHLYVNYHYGEIRKIRATDGQLIASAPVKGAMRSRWRKNNRLWIAQQTPSFRAQSSCAQSSEYSCGLAFSIISLNTDNMSWETLLTHQGAPMGAASVAIHAGDAMYIGTPYGQRILKVAINPPEHTE